MTKMLFNMKIIFTIAFIAVIWLLPEKGNAQKTEPPEAVFSKAVEAVKEETPAEEAPTADSSEASDTSSEEKPDK